MVHHNTSPKSLEKEKLEYFILYLPEKISGTVNCDPDRHFWHFSLQNYR